MAVEKFWNAGIYYNGWNLTGQTNKVTLNQKMSTLDTSVFGTETKIYAPGQAEMDASISGWWYTNQTAGSSAPDPYLFNNHATYGAPLLLTPKANADGGVAFMYPMTQSTFNFFGTFGELAPFSADFVFSLNTSSTDRVQPCRGYLGLPLTTSASASINGTYVQLPGTISSSQYLVMCCHVFSTDGTVTILVESDDNSGFATPTTRLTTGGLTTAGSFMDDVAGPIATDTYYRIKVTRAGGTTLTAVAAFGVA